MKSIFAAIAGVVLSASSAFAADAIEGVWRTASDNNGNSGLIEVKICGETYCGVLIKAFDSNGAEMESENIGREIISETVSEGEGKYSGKVYSPDTGKVYKSKLVLTENILEVSGCVFVICRNGGTWTRFK